jgi:hypothetical protein
VSLKPRQPFHRVDSNSNWQAVHAGSLGRFHTPVLLKDMPETPMAGTSPATEVQIEMHDA